MATKQVTPEQLNDAIDTLEDLIDSRDDGHKLEALLDSLYDELERMDLRTQRRRRRKD